VPPAPSAAGYGPAPAPAPTRPRRPGLPQRAPGQALGQSSLSRGGRSTGDPRYDTGSTPALPPEAAPGVHAPPTTEPTDAGRARGRDRRPSASPAPAPYAGHAGDEQSYADPSGYGAPAPGRSGRGRYARDDRAPAGPDGGYGGAGPAYPPPDAGYATGEHAYAAPADGYGGTGQAYADPSDRFASPDQAYASPDQSFGAPDQAYADPGGRFAAPDQAYAAPGQGFGAEQAYAEPGAWGPGADREWAGTATELDQGAPDTGQYEAYAPGTYVPDAPPDPFGPGPGAPLPGPGVLPDELAAPPGYGPDTEHDDRRGDDDGGGRHGRRRERPPAGLDDGPRLPQVPGFEGLRAVALLAILAFHQGYDLARGGYLGISSFFTLSGFLLGTLTLAEWSQSGHLSLGRLWERRARRIVPAYIVVLAIVVVLQFVLRVGTGASFRVDVLYALGFAENWRAVIAGHDAASIFVQPSPVQHLWSVGLLVQLIVVVPVAFVGLMKVTGKRWRLAGAVVAAVAVGSFALAKLTAEADGNGGLAYYGTHTRAGELLVGMALAFAVLSGSVRKLFESETGRQLIRFGGPAALVALAWLWSTTSLDDPALFGGITALNAVLTAWVILAVTTSGPTGTVLGSWPLRTLGRFAFTAYLIHWPVYLLIDEPRLELNEHLEFAARLGATLLLAVVLHYVVERPWRQGLRIGRPQLAAVLAGASVVVLVAVVVLPQQPPPGVSLSIGSGSGPGQLDVVVPAEGSEVARVALVGDGLAASLVPGATNWNATQADQQIRLATHITEGCPPGAPGPVRLAGRTVGEGVECRGWEPRLPRLLDAADTDVVVVVTGLDELGERDLDGAWRHLGDPAYDVWLSGQLDDLASTLADAGVPVLWATIPHVRMPGTDGDWTKHLENDPRRVDRFNDLVREAAAGHDSIEVVDLTAWAQDLPRGGEFGPDYRQDGTTFTERGANGAMTWLLTDALAAAGVEGGEPADQAGDATTTTTAAAR
jgi:peptidoglycan/LPS O-acetylase OafA/YrhL